MAPELILKETQRLACRLHREQGIPMKQACKLAARATFRTLGRPGKGGLGQLEPLKAAAADPQVTAIREAVTPWLWIFSLFGFGMSLLNTRRISRRACT